MRVRKSCEIDPTRVFLDIKPLHDAMFNLLQAELNLDRHSACVTAEHLIYAEQAGKSDHGLIRLHYLLRSFRPFGEIVMPPVPRSPSPGRVLTDGTGHIGYVVVHDGLYAGIREAKRYGSCLATAANAYPSGMLGHWAAMAAAEGVVSVIMASSPARVAAPGGGTPVIGTNPVCIGLPTEPPFIADVAMGAMTHGELLRARYEGKTLAPDAAVGPDGQPATSATEIDPADGVGALLSFGGRQAYKSFALGMAVELLTRIGDADPRALSGKRFGVVCFLVGPDALGTVLPIMSQWLHAQEAEGVRIPGWTSIRRARAQQEAGVVEVRCETLAVLAKIIAPDQLKAMTSI